MEIENAFELGLYARYLASIPKEYLHLDYEATCNFLCGFLVSYGNEYTCKNNHISIDISFEPFFWLNIFKKVGVETAYSDNQLFLPREAFFKKRSVFRDRT